MSVTGKTKLFRKDFNGRPAYSRSIASREFKDGQQTNNWIRTYENVQMPKDTNLPDGVTIEVVNGFEATYRMQNGSVGRKLVVTKYNVVDGDARQANDNAMDMPPFMAYEDDIPF